MRINHISVPSIATPIGTANSFKQSKPVINETKVSIIIPIYNQEKYLSKALDSLQKQTLKDIEIICVNDGSKDNSLRILNEYAQKDKRIKIINQSNQGTGVARNNGIKAAKGEYIAFMDPDDWLEPEAMETLYNKSKKENCDMVIYNFNRVNDEGELISKCNFQKRLQRFYNITEDKNFNWRDIKSRSLGGLYPVAWNKFCKYELIKEGKLHFSKSSLAEDNVFSIGATLKAKNIGYCGKYLYNYVIHNNSALRSKSDKNFCIFKAIDAIKNLLSQLNLTKELEKEFDGYVIRSVSYHIKNIMSVEKFKNLCQKRLSASQNNILNERYMANKKILPIINSLLLHKH